MASPDGPLARTRATPRFGSSGSWGAARRALVVRPHGAVARTALFVCLVLWLSISTAGQDFLSFQWDILLLEAGFLALFADESRASASGFSAGCFSA